MNKCIFMGRLTRDPEVRATNENMTIAKFGLAVDRRGKDAGADFLNMVAFGKTAESVERWLKKGTKVCVETHVQTGSYDHRDGYKVHTTDFIVDAWEFAEAKSEAPQKASQSATGANDFMSIPDSVEAEGLPWN